MKKKLELKKIYTQYIDERPDSLKNTSFKVKDIFVDVISKDSILLEQITEFNKFSAKIM